MGPLLALGAVPQWGRRPQPRVQWAVICMVFIEVAPGVRVNPSIFLGFLYLDGATFIIPEMDKDGISNI